MGFTKIKLFFVLILFHFLFLLPLYATTATALVNEPNPMDIEIGKNKEMTVKLTGSKLVSVNRRAGGFGGRGFGGSRGGGRGFSGSRGGGGRGFSGNRGGGRAVGGGEETKGSGNRVNGRPTLIPFYTAGAMPHRQNNQQHHNGSNRGKLDSPSLLMLLLLVVYLFNILHS